MSLAPFTYCLPVLLGYALFVGISGRLDPVSRPRRLNDRPSWALGLWCGLAAALTPMLLPRLGERLPLATEHGSPASAAWLLIALSLPGVFVWAIHRGAVSRRIDERTRASRELTMLQEVELGLPAERVRVADASWSEPAPPSSDAPDTRATRPHPAEPGPTCTDEADRIPRERHEVALGVAEDELGTLHLALCSELERREEAEEQLRVTQRALGVLETESGERTDSMIALEEELESRIRESATAEARATREAARRLEAQAEIVSLKRDVLAARHAARRSTEARARALSATTRSVALARQAVRARERTERQLHECRARLRESEDSLASRQSTISNLIGALEREQRRVRDGTAALSDRQEPPGRRPDGQHDAGGTHGGQGRLTSRPARKVARARSLLPGG